MLIFTPYLVVPKPYGACHVNEAIFHSLAQRMDEVGAHDLGSPSSDEIEKPKATVRLCRRRARRTAA